MHPPYFKRVGNVPLTTHFNGGNVPLAQVQDHLVCRVNPQPVQRVRIPRDSIVKLRRKGKTVCVVNNTQRNRVLTGLS